MKKLITLMLCISAFVIIANAKTLYVNAATGSDGNNGTSWITAYKTIAFAQAHGGINAGDNLWIAGGSTYSIPSAASNLTAQSISLSQWSYNWYGGFKGDETSLSQRPLADNDGNGIVEPWEFQYPTVLSFTLSSDASAFNGGNGDFNGFTMSATAALTTRFNFVYTIATGTKFSNNIVKNNTVTLSATSSASDTFWPFIKMQGTVNNCLFEKNTITVNNTINAYCWPFIWVANSTTASFGTKFSNSIIRNNKVTVNYTSSAATTNSGTRGMILGIAEASKTAGLPTVVANCVFNNNEMIYVPSSGNASGTKLWNGSTIYMAGSNGVASADSLINCTLVNNKGTLMYNGGLFISNDATAYHYVYNNVLYNNKNFDGTGTFVSNMYNSATTGQGIISNNITNGGAISNTSTQIVNQDNTLDAVTNKPNFKTPTTTLGNTTDNSSETSYWSITSGSYLIAKGITTSNLRDKNGIPFATNPSVGAYEYNATNGISQVKNITDIVLCSKGRILSKIESNIIVYNFKGIEVWSGHMTIGQEVKLQPGTYIVESLTNNGKAVQKVVL